MKLNTFVSKFKCKNESEKSFCIKCAVINLTVSIVFKILSLGKQINETCTLTSDWLCLTCFYNQHCLEWSVDLVNSLGIRWHFALILSFSRFSNVVVLVCQWKQEKEHMTTFKWFSLKHQWSKCLTLSIFAVFVNDTHMSTDTHTL